MNIDARADHIASTLKQCYSVALGILKIVNILTDFTNTSLQNTMNFNYSLFQVIKYICFIKNGKTKQIKEIAEIHVMYDMT